MVGRPSRRTLVRWNDDHDKELLLWTIYCCHEQGVKVPFGRIAQCMGAAFSEGACIQHLAKIRNKMEEAGLHVPPTQKRGTVSRSSSSIYKSKPKEITAPVPRIRPEPFGGDGSGDTIVTVVEESDDEEQSAINALFPIVPCPALHSRPKKRVRSSAKARKNLGTFKDDLGDDDPIIGELYDSDNEYGAKRLPIGKIESTVTDEGTQFNPSTSATTHVDMLDAILVPVAQGQDQTQDMHQTRGVRRKSSAIVDHDDEEYEPVQDSKNKSRTKKSRAPSNARVKKQKVGNDEAKSGNRAHEINVGVSKIPGSYEADRAAMPPPSLPITTDTFDWNANFMHQPFAFHHRSGFNTSGVADFGSSYPASDNGSFDASYSTGMGNVNLSAYSQPMLNSSYQAVTPYASAPGTRTPSFASASSTSTIESQPASWNQPLRSPGFPNPWEASTVLNTAMETPGANENTRINIFGSPIRGESFIDGIGQIMYNGTFHGRGADPAEADGGQESLFGGNGEDAKSSFNFNDYIRHSSCTDE